MDKLTKEMALSAVEDIRRAANDDEGAHSMEDSLYLAFVECCAAGLYEPGEAAEVAKVVLSTHDIDFARWCA